HRTPVGSSRVGWTGGDHASALAPRLSTPEGQAGGFPGGAKPRPCGALSTILAMQSKGRRALAWATRAREELAAAQNTDEDFEYRFVVCPAPARRPRWTTNSSSRPDLGVTVRPRPGHLSAGAPDAAQPADCASNP